MTQRPIDSADHSSSPEQAAPSPYRIVSAAEGGGAFPSDRHWGVFGELKTAESELMGAMTEGVRLSVECLRGADPLAGVDPPWSDESWERLNLVFSTCAAVLGRSQGELVFEGARPAAGGGGELVFNKKSKALLGRFFKASMGLPKTHFEMAVWGLIEAGVKSHPNSFCVERSVPFFVGPPSARKIIDKMAEAAGPMQTPRLDAVGKARDAMEKSWLLLKQRPPLVSSEYIGRARVGVPNAWESCSEIFAALSVMEELTESTRPKRGRQLAEAPIPRI